MLNPTQYKSSISHHQWYLEVYNLFLNFKSKIVSYTKKLNFMEQYFKNDSNNNTNKLGRCYIIVPEFFLVLLLHVGDHELKQHAGFVSGLEWHVWACECAVWNSVWCGQAQADFHLEKPWPLGNDHAPLVVAGDCLHLNYWFEKGFCFLESQSPGMVRLLEMSRSWKDLRQKTLRTPKAMGLTYERWTQGFGRILLHQLSQHTSTMWKTVNTTDPVPVPENRLGVDVLYVCSSRMAS